jgi:hypothetical protein
MFSRMKSSVKCRFVSMTAKSITVTYGLLLFSILSQSEAQVRVKPQAVVSFIVTDPFGNQLPYRCRQFTDTRTKVDLSEGFDGLRSGGIPYGQYRYVLTRTDVQSKFSELTGEVSVSEPTVWLSLSHSGMIVFSEGQEGTVDVTPPAPFVILGTVEPAPAIAAPTWVRLQPLYQNFRLETTVDDQGKFRFYKAVKGAFLILVFQGPQLVALKPVTLSLSKGQKIEVDMSKDRYPPH